MKKLLITALLPLAMSQSYAQVNQYVVTKDNNPIVSNYVITKESLKSQHTDKTVFTLEKPVNIKSLPPATSFNITEVLKSNKPLVQNYKLEAKAVPRLAPNKPIVASTIPKKAKIKPVAEPGLLPHTK